MPRFIGAPSVMTFRQDCNFSDKFVFTYLTIYFKVWFVWCSLAMTKDIYFLGSNMCKILHHKDIKDCSKYSGYNFGFNSYDPLIQTEIT